MKIQIKKPLIVMFVFTVVSVVFISDQYLNCVPHPTPPRKIEQDHKRISLTHLWSLTLPLDNAKNAFPLPMSDQKLYAMTACGQVYVLDLETGTPELLTSVPLSPKMMLYDAPQKQLYITAGDSFIALDATSGATHWDQYFSFFERNYTPIYLTNDGLLLVDSYRKKFYRVDKTTGSLQQLEAPNNTIYLEGDVAYLKSEENQIYAKTLSEDKLLWQRTESTRVCEFHLISNDYFSIGCEKQLVIHKQNGKLIWQSPIILASNTFFYENALYALGVDAMLYRFDPASKDTAPLLQFEGTDFVPMLMQSYIQINDTFLALYFQDTNLLSVYKVVPDMNER
jgi:outer membrane protein assembly factor BamB